MSVDQSILSDIGVGVAHARVFRLLASAFVRAGGVVTVGDLTVTGDPTALKVNVSAGIGIVPMGALQGFEPFVVDVQESVTLAPATSSRTDLIYAAVQSKEFGDVLNHKAIGYQQGGAGSTIVPPISPPIPAGVLNLAKIGVPSGATLGTQCTITSLLDTAAPVRSGGYRSGDISYAGDNYAQVIRSTTQSLPTTVITSGNADTTAWTSVNWNTVTAQVSSDGNNMADVANNQMLVPSSDYYSGSVTVTFPATTSPTGIRACRVRTIQGGLVSQVMNLAGDSGFLPHRITVPYEAYLLGGHHLVVEIMHTQGSTLVLPAAGGYNACTWSHQRSSGR